MAEIKVKYKQKECVMLFDDEDLPIVEACGYLRIKNNGYVMATLCTNKIKEVSELIGRQLREKERCDRNGLRLEIALHSLLLHEEGKEVDHINRNRLDNRRENLRLVTRQENCWNKSKQKNNKSGYIGVCFDKKASSKNPWKAYAKHDGKNYNLGFYSTKEEAARVRDKFIIEKRGKQAFYALNFPEEWIYDENSKKCIYVG